MKRALGLPRRLAGGWAAVLAGAFAMLALVACGDDEGTDTNERQRPAFGDPGDPEIPDAGSDAGDAEVTVERGPCCMVTFAVLDDDRVEERSAHLRGGDVPFYVMDSDSDVDLTLDEGRWTVELCMPQVYDSFYYYEFEIPADEGDGGFIETRFNPNAPNRSHPEFGFVNTYSPVDDCDDLDPAPHGDTSS